MSSFPSLNPNPRPRPHPHPNPNQVRDCWSVAFGDAHSTASRLVAAGYDNGDVKVLDLVAGKMRWETNVSNGVCGVEFDRKDIEMNKLVVTRGTLTLTLTPTLTLTLTLTPTLTPTLTLTLTLTLTRRSAARPSG